MHNTCRVKCVGGQSSLRCVLCNISALPSAPPALGLSEIITPGVVFQSMGSEERYLCLPYSYGEEEGEGALVGRGGVGRLVTGVIFLP